MVRSDRSRDDSVLIVRAMRLGHMGDPDGAPVQCLLYTDAEGVFPACDGCMAGCEAPR